MKKTTTDTRSFADDPQRNPKRDDTQDEGSRELFLNNPEHPLKVAVRQGKHPMPEDPLPTEAPEPLYHPHSIPKARSKTKNNNK